MTVDRAGTCGGARRGPIRRCPRSGAAPTSTRRPTAAASTARSASSRRSRPPRRSQASGGARRTIAVVAFRLEEGPRFGRGVFGSRALFGELEADEADLVDADGVTLGEAFTALGLGEPARRGDPRTCCPRCFVEAHIEQGPSLAAQGASLGVVTSIAGMAGIELVFPGRRGHAGTVPMACGRTRSARRPGFVRGVHDAARSLPGAVATVGRLDVSPGATNTIPGRVELFADLRAPDERPARRAGRRRRRAPPQPRRRRRRVPGRGPPALALRARGDGPAPSDALRRAIAGAGLEPVELPSGAGHDAAITGGGGRPVGDALRTKRRGRREPRARGGDGRRRGCRGRGRARGRAPGARRMTTGRGSRGRRSPS